jgi:hypothetical protein
MIRVGERLRTSPLAHGYHGRGAGGEGCGVGASLGGFVNPVHTLAYVIALLALAFVQPALAEGGQAGLIVVFATGDVHQASIPLDEGPASGMCLLSRAGLSVISVSDPDGKTAICRIAEVGCSFPQEDCLCQCGDPCLAWHYWVWQDGGWEPFEGSPTERSITSGDLDAWVWGTADDLPPEPDSPLALPQAVVDDDAYPEPPDQPPTDEPYPGVTDEPGDESTPEPRATSTPRPTATSAGTSGPAPSQTDAATATSTQTAPPPSDTPTLERIELPTEPATPPASTSPGVRPAEETPDAGATLVVRAATRGAATPAQPEQRPDPDARVPAPQLVAAAGALLALVAGAAWWRWRQSRSEEPPTA